jgi:hypothetical protein
VVVEADFPAEALAAVAAERFRIAKIAEIPPQQAKAGLAGGPRLPKIAKIEKQNLITGGAETQRNPVIARSAGIAKIKKTKFLDGLQRFGS